MKAFVTLVALIAAVSLYAEPATQPVTPPAIGDTATDFDLQTLDGKSVKLSELTTSGPVVLIELRGWVGYQCPVCTKQVGQFIGQAKQFEKTGTRVVMVYPGSAEKLKDHAADFITGKSLPDNFYFVIDPDLSFTNAWGLHWNAKGENAYPATFVIDKKQTIQFSKVSKSHGDRASVKEVLDAIGKL
jgi:peroxiredoxin Q/BCP